MWCNAIGLVGWCANMSGPRESVRVYASHTLGQHLQGDVAMQFRVARAVDLAHAARPERGDDLVGARRDGPWRGWRATAWDCPTLLARRADRPARTHWPPAVDRGSCRPRRPTPAALRPRDATPRLHRLPQSGRPRTPRPAVPRRPETAPSPAAIARRSWSGCGYEAFQLLEPVLHEDHLRWRQSRWRFLPERQQEPASIRRHVVTASPPGPEIGVCE